MPTMLTCVRNNKIHYHLIWGRCSSRGFEEEVTFGWVLKISRSFLGRKDSTGVAERTAWIKAWSCERVWHTQGPEGTMGYLENWEWETVRDEIERWFVAWLGSLSYPPSVSILSFKAGRAIEVFTQGKFRRVPWHESEGGSEQVD